MKMSTNDSKTTQMQTDHSTMKTIESIIRGAALAMALAAVSGVASAQDHGSTAIDEHSMLAMSTSEHSEINSDLGSTALAVARMDAWLGTFDSIRGALERNDGFIKSDDELVLAFLFEPMEGESRLLRSFMNDVVAAMEAVPETFYARLDTKVGELWSEIHRVAPRVSPLAGREADARVRSAIERRVLQGAPDARVLRTLVSGDKWIARVGDFGIPKSEYRKGFVTYRLPGQDLIVCQQIVVERPYFGSDFDFRVKLGYLRLQTTP